MEIIEAPKPTHREPTMAQLRNMAKGVEETLDAPETPLKEEKPEQEKTAAESEAPVKEAKEKKKEAESAPASDKQQGEPEEELPEGVKKRIAKEIAKQDLIDALIREARDKTRAKEAELASLQSKQGSEPVKQTEPKKDGPPSFPNIAEFDGTITEYNAAVAKFQQEYAEWLQKQTRDTVSREFQEQQARESSKKEWDAAVQKHGNDFPALMDALGKELPQELQTAISALEDWSGVAVHLAKNEEERDSILEKFKTSPLSAIAALGKLEDRLKPAAKPAVAEKKEELPKPLKAVAGGARGVAPAIDLETAPMSTFRREIKRLRGEA